MKSIMIRRQMFKGLFARIAAIVLFTTLLTAAPFHAALGATAPSLGMAQSFAVLGATTVTNTGPTLITGDLGLNPGSAVTGFPPGLVSGAIHAADALSLQAQTDTTTAYINLAGQECSTTFGVPTDIGGMTLVPGVYCFADSVQITGVLTLNGGDDPNAVWVFKIASTLSTASSASVSLINSAQPCNVFWQVTSSAVIGTSTTFVGNILALTSISLFTNASVSGRALARNGAVTMDSNAVAISTCAIIPPVTPIPPTPIPPTLGKEFSPDTIYAGGSSTLTITLSNPNSTVANLTAPLTDFLPSGMFVNGHDNSCNSNCGGTITHNMEMTSAILTGASIPANGSCTITVEVTAPSVGDYTNFLAIGALQTSNGSNATEAVASLTVLTAPEDIAPKIKKAFSPATINAGGVSTLTITLRNPNSTVANLTAPLTDFFPSGMYVNGHDNSCNSCNFNCGGTITHNMEMTSAILTGASIPANGSCTVTIDVTAPSAGTYINSIAAGALQTDKGDNAAEASATLIVLAITPTGTVPTLSKAFSPSTIAACKVSTLTITLSNPSSTAANLTAPLINYLPSGVVVAKNNLFTTTCGGIVAANTGSSKVILTGGSIPANGSCTVTVNVTAPSDGSYINTLAIGALQTSNGNNATEAVATLIVKTN